ncbi:MAG: hypothetical protein ACTHJT_05020 [Cytophaga sp.]|uniref:hypothetical protein n=1 Tax=Cytophaga sp. TaxID=29535 RepID=UPI003F7E4331
MKKQFLLPALLLIGFTSALTSCKKDKDDALSPSMQACKVDYATTNADSTQLTYDSEGRVTKEQTFNKSSNSQGYTLYSYAAHKITEKEYDENGNQTSQTDYYLNSNNNAGYSVYIEDGDTDNADTTWYSYDANKHNTRQVTKNTTTIVGISSSTYDTTWYTYSGNNLTKSEEKINGGDLETTVYSYGSDDAKTQFLAPGQNYSPVLGLYGETSDQLPTSATIGSTTVTYVYEFNSQGYVTRYKVVNSGVTQNDIHFTYDCK